MTDPVAECTCGATYDLDGFKRLRLLRAYPMNGSITLEVRRCACGAWHAVHFGECGDVVNPSSGGFSARK
jgi:hypothetical protein